MLAHGVASHTGQSGTHRLILHRLPRLKLHPGKLLREVMPGRAIPLAAPSRCHPGGSPRELFLEIQAGQRARPTATTYGLSNSCSLSPELVEPLPLVQGVTAAEVH
jgi:hypothetical protein